MPDGDIWEGGVGGGGGGRAQNDRSPNVVDTYYHDLRLNLTPPSTPPPKNEIIQFNYWPINGPQGVTGRLYIKSS